MSLSSSPRHLVGMSTFKWRILTPSPVVLIPAAHLRTRAQASYDLSSPTCASPRDFVSKPDSESTRFPGSLQPPSWLKPTSPLAQPRSCLLTHAQLPLLPPEPILRALLWGRQRHLQELQIASFLSSPKIPSRLPISLTMTLFTRAQKSLLEGLGQ